MHALHQAAGATRGGRSGGGGGALGKARKPALTQGQERGQDDQDDGARAWRSSSSCCCRRHGCGCGFVVCGWDRKKEEARRRGKQRRRGDDEAVVSLCLPLCVRPAGSHAPSATRRASLPCPVHVVMRGGDGGGSPKCLPFPPSLLHHHLIPPHSLHTTHIHTPQGHARSTTTATSTASP